MLSFLGIGGAFAVELKNCSAYYKENQYLLLIDCGENIFEEIIKAKLLNNVAKLDILLTHFHSDHVGSLGSLLFYCDKLGISDANLIYPNKERLNELIELFGVKKCNLNILVPDEFKTFQIREYKQDHSFMEAYGYLLILNGKVIYYSGDTKSIPNEVLDMLVRNEIDFFYQDVCNGKNDYHMSLNELTDLIPKDLRKKIKCMHFNSIAEIEDIKNRGFSLVKIKKNI